MSGADRAISAIAPLAAHPAPFLHRFREEFIAARHRVGRVQPACFDQHARRGCDRFDPTHEPIPYDKYLERLNQETRLTPRASHTDSSCIGRHNDEAAKRSPTEPVTTNWPHIGDVTPVPPPPPRDQLRVIYQIDPPTRPGHLIDLLL